MDVDPDGATWRKSTYSNGTGGNCVEVADLPGGRAVRDSKHPEGPILVFTREGWRAFVQGIQAGELCAELEPGQAACICRESPGHDPSFAERVGGSPHADGSLLCLHRMVTAAKRPKQAATARKNH
jgi:hypothetical protein